MGTTPTHDAIDTGQSPTLASPETPTVDYVAHTNPRDEPFAPSAQVVLMTSEAAVVAATGACSSLSRPRAYGENGRIIELGQHHNAVAIIVGAPTIMGIQLEELIHDWSAEHPKARSNMRKYAESFRKHLGRQVTRLGESTRRDWTVLQIEAQINGIAADLVAVPAQHDDPRDMQTRIDECVEMHVRRLAAFSKSATVDDSDIESLLSDRASDLERLVRDAIHSAFSHYENDIFQTLPCLIGAAERIRTTVPRLVLTHHLESERQSTIAFVGCGSKEIQPRMVTLSLSGITVGTRLQSQTIETRPLAIDDDPIIETFGGSDMAYNLVFGYHPDRPGLMSSPPQQTPPSADDPEIEDPETWVDEHADLPFVQAILNLHPADLVDFASALVTLEALDAIARRGGQPHHLEDRRRLHRVLRPQVALITGDHRPFRVR